MNAPDRFANFAICAADAETVGTARWRAGFGVEFDQRQRKAMSQKQRQSASGAHLALDVIEQTLPSVAA